jgi:hypothetical protein
MFAEWDPYVSISYADHIEREGIGLFNWVCESFAGMEMQKSGPILACNCTHFAVAPFMPGSSPNTSSPAHL